MKKIKRQYSRREIEKILKYNGWHLARQNGSHKIYMNDEGHHVTIGSCSYNSMIFQRLIKENNMNII